MGGSVRLDKSIDDIVSSMSSSLPVIGPRIVVLCLLSARHDEIRPMVVIHIHIPPGRDEIKRGQRRDLGAMPS